MIARNVGKWWNRDLMRSTTDQLDTPLVCWLSDDNDRFYCEIPLNANWYNKLLTLPTPQRRFVLIVVLAEKYKLIIPKQTEVSQSRCFFDRDEHTLVSCLSANFKNWSNAGSGRNFATSDKIEGQAWNQLSHSVHGATRRKDFSNSVVTVVQNRLNCCFCTKSQPNLIQL